MGFVSVETEDEAHRAALERTAGECRDWGLCGGAVSGHTASNVNGPLSAIRTSGGSGVSSGDRFCSNWLQLP